MRSGNSRGVMLALGLACALAFTATVSCRADLFHTIPRLVPAVDVNTGGPYYAPPIPYGHYVGKDLAGKCSKMLGGILGHGACGACGGNGCGLCGGSGCGGCGNGGGQGGPCANGNGGPCANGNGLCGGGHAAGGPCQSPAGAGHGLGGLFHHKKANGAGLCGQATTAVVPSAQSVPMASEQCGAPGCGLGGKHRHLGGGLCGACGGKGGNGGHATLRRQRPGQRRNGCGACGGKGCSLCGNGGGTGCGLCGGRGCGACAKAHGLINHLLHRDKIKWFVGPGGPVPLTPGYTPYVVTTRSPRDFFAFPPMTP